MMNEWDATSYYPVCSRQKDRETVLEIGTGADASMMAAKTWRTHRRSCEAVSLIAETARRSSAQTLHARRAWSKTYLDIELGKDLGKADSCT